jgi:hypothetical protein
MLSRAGLLPSDVGAPSLRGAQQAAADAGEANAGDSCAAADATPRDSKAARCVQLQQLEHSSPVWDACWRGNASEHQCTSLCANQTASKQANLSRADAVAAFKSV